jgi:predicted flap endonuclease-1-like 5' DNA nuclease
MSILETLGVKTSLFVDSEIELMEKAINDGQYEHLSAIITQLSPEKVAEIEKIQNQLRPRTFTFDSEEQKNFEIWLSKHGVQELTPEIEADWQAKIEKERVEKLEQLTGGKQEVKAQTVDGTSATSAVLENTLLSVKGLGPKSIEKLRETGINTVEEFKKLPYTDKEKVLGPIVAAKFETFN